MTNFGNEDFGLITLTDALTNSVNTVWGEVGEKLGKRTMYKYMRRFGFDREPLIDLPDDEKRASGVYGRNGQLLGPADAIDIGRVAIGQERLQVTPLQMALVASAVGNGGRLMRPHLVRADQGPRRQDRAKGEAQRAERRDEAARRRLSWGR